MSDPTPKAIVDGSGRVLNTVMVGPDYAAPDGCILVNIGPGAEPGGTYANGRFTPSASLAPTVTGNQWAFALSNLGLASVWQVGVTKSKASDQVRIGLIARDTPLLATDPLLARVAGNAGTVDGTASGPPLIAVATVFSTAQGMPL